MHMDRNGATWHGEAACSRPHVDQEIFFPLDTDHIGATGRHQQLYGDDGLHARLVCSTCPVVTECWEANRDLECGIIAGTDETDRVKMLLLAERREARDAAAAHRPARRITWRDLPVPVQPFLPTNKLRSAAKYFEKGRTLVEAAERAGLGVKPVPGRESSQEQLTRSRREHRRRTA